MLPCSINFRHTLVIHSFKKVLINYIGWYNNDFALYYHPEKFYINIWGGHSISTH